MQLTIIQESEHANFEAVWSTCNLEGLTLEVQTPGALTGGSSKRLPLFGVKGHPNIEVRSSLQPPPHRLRLHYVQPKCGFSFVTTAS